jgi:hypothetical protein
VAELLLRILVAREAAEPLGEDAEADPRNQENTLYVRDAAKLAERVRTAPRFRLGIGKEI